MRTTSRTIRETAICIAMAASATIASAQISLSSAVDLALRSNPKVRAAQADVDKAKAVVSATHDAYIPSAGATGGYGTSTGVPLGVPVVFGLASNSLLFSFSQRDNMRAADAGLHAASLSLSETRDQVAEDVIVTYLQLNNAEQRQAVMSEELGFANRLVAIIQDRLDAGRDTRSELLHAQRTSKQLELQQLQVQDQLSTLSDHLARLIGLPGNHIQTVPASVPALPTVASLIEPVQPGAALLPEPPDSYGVHAAFATAHSKQELAFGEARYKFRPQVSLDFNYSRISTSHTDYTDYYPGFRTQSENAASIGMQIQVPLFDRAHDAKAREAAADAAQAYFTALDQRNLFREGRLKLQHGAAELQARAAITVIDRDLAQEDLNTILIQLAGPGDADSGKPQLTPKDEQKARIQERARTLDVLDAEFQLSQAQVNLMRQTGQLDGWLHGLAAAPEKVTAAPR